MCKYEIKKIFSRTGAKIAVILMLLMVAVCCFLAADVPYIDENGERTTGPAAVAKLKAARKEWSGFLDEEKIRQAILENRRIRETPQAQSDDITESNIAFGWGQGVDEIRDLLNYAYARGFQDYDYYRADSLSADDAGKFYENRVALLADWLDEAAADQFSDAEKEYLLNQYRGLKTPIFYDYMEGWVQLFEYSPVIIMITMLILGYLIAGIFSSEFSWKSDAIFFSSKHGRDSAVRAKIQAGLLVITIGYFAAILLYSAVLLLYLGTDGWQCPVQADWGSWKCFYSLTNLQKYFLVVLGGYVGCLFISLLGMYVSAKTRSAVLAVMVPFTLIFIPSFLANINSPLVNKCLSLLPDQLLQVNASLDYFNVFSLGQKVLGAIPILFVLYALLAVMLPPVIYRVYRKTQIG